VKKKKDLDGTDTEGRWIIAVCEAGRNNGTKVWQLDGLLKI
jgi:hypothetical protein